MNNAPRPLFRHSVEPRPEECARACEQCATLCDHTLQADPSYRHSIERFTETQLTLISFASVCNLTAAALREKRGDIGEMCSWCWQVCQDFSDRVSCDARTWRRFEAAVRNCSSLCASVAACCEGGRAHTARPARPSAGRRF